MPICLDRLPSGHRPWGGANGPRRTSTVEFRESDANCIDIGLINNMRGEALEVTERQFRTQLDAAAEGMVVRLNLYTLPPSGRPEMGGHHVRSLYSDISDLWDSHLDGLIVTGTEPRAMDLMDEPYWGSLTKLLEWAEQHTHSAVWSCLAAHAALLHLDGIRRRRLSDKRFGVFECARVSDHPLTSRLPAQFEIPHSRWNDIAEDALITCGYGVLTRSEEAGIDAFAKQRKSLFVFFQGHPEYDGDTLLLEYRRDIGRFLRRERDLYPSMPQGYFDGDTIDELTALQQRALSDRRVDLLTDFPTALLTGRVKNTWRPAAACVYRNWLLYLCEQKERHLRARQGRGEYKRAGVATFG